MHTTILVTGATGTVGREVIKQLSMLEGDEIRVRAGVHSVITGENLKRLPGVEISEMDFENQESLHAAFTHADKLFMVAPFADDQVEMEKTLVDEAKRTGVKHIVKLSSMGADEEPGILLGLWHREIERYIEDSGISYTFLRPTSFMQNYIDYNAASIKQEGKFYQPLGNGKVSYIDARDIAAVGVETLLKEGHVGKIYELTGPEALSNNEVAALLSEVSGKQVAYIDTPEAEAREAMLAQGTPEWMADAMLELYGVYKSGSATKTTTTVEDVTGQKPHTMRQFLEDHREDFA
ncbi:SDR family oxidoreductase [Pontibacter rugosus]|uniref:SDR family oxidoreductase n=1 Tax=Pontibacter rugosus TaxID=1745966 RepID=A0ABW3SIR6_9BACT